jgi:signal peptidase II
MLSIIIIALIIVLDQVTKFFVTKYIEYGERISIIKNFFFLTNHENSGAAWGIFPNGRYFFITITIILSIIMIYYLFKTDNKYYKMSLVLIIGGAIGNLIDRIIKGRVVDFLDFHFGSYNFPTFNVADSSIVIGTFLLAFYILIGYTGQDHKGEKDY